MFKIIMDFDNLEDSAQTTNFSVWGNAYVEHDGFFFPNKEWYDVTSSLLDMWLSEISNFFSGNCDNCELYFMDGPFLIYLTQLSKNYVCISLIERPGKVQREFSIPAEVLVEELMQCAKLFLTKCTAQSSKIVETKLYKRVLTNIALLGCLHSKYQTREGVLPQIDTNS